MKKYIYKEAVDFLNNQFWHDSVAYEFMINRRNSSDQFIISLDLISDYDSWQSKNTNLIFSDCYYIENKMNGGVTCMSNGEMISDATAKLNSPLIDKVKNTWQNKIDTNLLHFSMVLASTGSEINLVCSCISIEESNDKNNNNALPPIKPKI